MEGYILELELLHWEVVLLLMHFRFIHKKELNNSLN